jgi:hypothetical protein
MFCSALQQLFQTISIQFSLLALICFKLIARWWLKILKNNHPEPYPLNQLNCTNFDPP